MKDSRPEWPLPRLSPKPSREVKVQVKELERQRAELEALRKENAALRWRASRKPWTRHQKRLALGLSLIMVATAFSALIYVQYATNSGLFSPAPTPGPTPGPIALANTIGVVTKGAGEAGIACSSKTSCQTNITAYPESVVVVGWSNYARATFTTDVVKAPTTLTAVQMENESAASHPNVALVGFLYKVTTSATAHVFFNTTAASYTNVEAFDVNYTTVNATYDSGVGASDGNSTAASASCTPTVSGELILAMEAADFAANEKTTAGTGQTHILGEATTTRLNTGNSSYYYDTSVTAQSMTETLSVSDAWSMACVGMLPTKVPSAPTGLTVGSVTTTTVPLTWSAANTGQGGFYTAGEVYQATYSAGSCGAYTAVLAASSPYTSGTVTGLTALSTYCFEVTDSNTTGASNDSVAVTNVETQGAPPAQSNLNVVAQSGTTTVLNVNWTQVAGNPTAFVNSTIRYTQTSGCASGNTYINDGDPSSMFYQITGLTANKTYYVEVAEWNSVGIGSWGSCVSASTSATPAHPFGLGTTAQTLTSVTLTWTNPTGVTVANDTVSYGTPVATPAPFCSSLKQVSAGSTSQFAVIGLQGNTKYCFAVAAWNAGGIESAFSTYLNVSTLSPYPGQAYALTESANTTSSVTLTWLNSPPASGGVVNVTVLYGTSCGVAGVAGWTNHVSVGNSTTYTISSGLNHHTAYCVSVLDWSNAGQGTDANGIFVYLLNAVPGAPTITEQSASRSAITITWTYVPYATGGYPIVNNTVWYKLNTCGSGMTTISTVGNVTSWQITGLTGGSTYCIETTAYSNGGQSAFSNQLTVVAQSSTPPAPIFDVPLITYGETWVYLVWSNPAGYTLYNNSVYVGPSGGACGTGYSVASGWSAVDNLRGVYTYYNVTGLATGTAYCFEAVDWDGPSNFSTPFFTFTLGPTGNVTGIVITGQQAVLDTWLIILAVIGIAVAVYFGWKRDRDRPKIVEVMR